MRGRDTRKQDRKQEREQKPAGRDQAAARDTQQSLITRLARALLPPREAEGGRK
jgi:hypothetical protein